MRDKVFGICMARDEADIIGYVVEHMMGQVDAVIVADNLSVDNTGALAREAGAHVLFDPDPAYRQSVKMTNLAHYAAVDGAEWIVPFDADEVWYTVSGLTLKEELLSLPGRVYSANYYNYGNTTEDDKTEPNPIKRMRYRNMSHCYQKVACRYAEDLMIHQGNHLVQYGDSTSMGTPGKLRINHYPYRSEEQFVSKAKNGIAAYRAAPEIPYNVGKHWRDFGEIAERSEAEAYAVFRGHAFLDPNDLKNVEFDPFYKEP